MHLPNPVSVESISENPEEESAFYQQVRYNVKNSNSIMRAP